VSISRFRSRGVGRESGRLLASGWSAGVVFQLVTGMLRLIPDASGNRVTLDRPRLPSWLELRGLRVAKSRIDLRVTQGRESAAVELLARDGDAEVVVRR
jgi:hypothetical protein